MGRNDPEEQLISAHTRRLHLEIPPQPDDTTCGPTCLHAVYGFFGDEAPLDDVVRQVFDSIGLENGGTLGALLGVHALRRGYRATLHSFNLDVFDPTWFRLDRARLLAKLDERAEAVASSPRLHTTVAAYREYLALGGELRFADLSPRLLWRLLDRDLPVLTGLSATFLYRESREIPDTNTPDDVHGEPAGHFVVLHGYDERSGKVRVGDPLQPGPFAASGLYRVGIDRLINAILLGVLTYDANLLQIEPSRAPRRTVS